MVLGYLPDFASLRALVYLLPAYFDVYNMDREQIFTNITIRMLREEGFDLLHLGTWVRLCIPKTGPSPRGVKSIFDSCGRQIREGKQVKLSVKECTDLLTINDSNQMWVSETEPLETKPWNKACGHRTKCSDERCRGHQLTCKHSSTSFGRRYYGRLPSLDSKSLLCHDAEYPESRLDRGFSHNDNDKNFHATLLKGEEWLNMKTTS